MGRFITLLIALFSIQAQAASDIGGPSCSPSQAELLLNSTPSPHHAITVEEAARRVPVGQFEGPFESYMEWYTQLGAAVKAVNNSINPLDWVEVVSPDMTGFYRPSKSSQVRDQWIIGVVSGAKKPIHTFAGKVISVQTQPHFRVTLETQDGPQAIDISGASLLLKFNPQIRVRYPSDAHLTRVPRTNATRIRSHPAPPRPPQHSPALQLNLPLSPPARQKK